VEELEVLAGKADEALAAGKDKTNPRSSYKEMMELASNASASRRYH